MQACLPLLCAIHHTWAHERSLRSSEHGAPKNAFNVIFQALTQSRLRFIFPALLVSWASILTAINTASLRSTYICPASADSWTRSYQILGVLLDCHLLQTGVQNLGKTRGENSSRPNSQNYDILAWIFLVRYALLSRHACVHAYR